MPDKTFKYQLNRMTSEFSDPKLEREFWSHSAIADKLSCYVVFGVSLFGTILFMFNDSIIFGSLDFFSPLMIARIIVAVVISILIVSVRLANQSKTVHLAVNIWIALIISFVYIINFSRPSDYYHHVLIDLLAISFMYLFLPNSYKNKIVWGILYTVVVFGFLELFRPDIPIVAKRVTYFVFISANIAGSVVSYQTKFRQRRLYWALKLQSKLSTELESALTEKSEALKTLEAMYKSKGDLYLTLVHDLRNPLNAMIGLTQVIQDAGEDETVEGKPLSQRIIDVGHSMNATLEALLMWSRLDSDKMRIDMDEAPLSQMIFNVKTEVNANLQFKNISLVVQNEVQHDVVCNQKMLEATLRNLVSNAIKFSNKGSKIILRVTESSDDILFEIIDEGLGITPETLEKLRARVGVESKIGTSGETGTGLGLVIVRDFLSQHKSLLEIESTFGKGTTMHFKIPKNLAL